MSILLQHEITMLKKMISALGAHVEEALEKAVRSVTERDLDAAQEVLEADAEIDSMEVAVEEECLKILALHQPVATDLRFIITVLKVNNDLERIGDLATDIAEQSVALMREEACDIPFDLPGMVRRVETMLGRSLDALLDVDSEAARAVREADDEVDSINRQMYASVVASIKEKPKRVQQLIRLLSVSHKLERVADHATNIAEDVIYMVEGTIVRHGN